MDINLLPFTVLWMVLAALVISLIVYRKWVAKDEDHSLHVTASEIGMVSRQTFVARRIESIDRWGQMLTIAALVCGLALGAGYLYQNWLATGSILTR